MSADFLPDYFETRFRVPALDGWPPRFAIVTAYATTGASWPPEKNAAADAALAADLARVGVFLRRAVGYSPRTGHAEPGYAVALELAAACALGRRYAQDAVYWIDGDRLSVVKCDAPATRAPVGPFRARLDHDPESAARDP